LRVGSGLGAALEGVFLMDIQAAKEQCEAVTHHVGGWAWRRRADGSKFADGTPVCEVVAADRTIIAYDVGEPEARFIAAAHSDLPAALEALEEAQGKIGVVRGRAKEARKVMERDIYLFAGDILAILGEIE